MMIWLSILIFIISFFVIAKSGGWIVQSLSNIARILKWREFIVASLIMSFASTLPELFIAINSSIKKVPQLSIGNVIGGGVIYLTLVIGIGTILAKKIKFQSKIIKRSSAFAVLYLFFPILLFVDGYFSRMDGIILILTLIFYFQELIRHQKKFSKVYNHYRKNNRKRLLDFAKQFCIFAFGILILLIGSKGVVFAAMNVAALTPISLFIIGLLIVAIGTSLPEIVFAIESTRLGYKEMILGDVLGSVVIDAGLVLGLVGIICPFQVVNMPQYVLGIAFSILAAGFFFVFSRTRNEINKREGIILLGIYGLFFVSQIVYEILKH